MVPVAGVGEGGCTGQLQGFGQKRGRGICRVPVLSSRDSRDQSVSLLRSHGVGHPSLPEGCFPVCVHWWPAAKEHCCLTLHRLHRREQSRREHLSLLLGTHSSPLLTKADEKAGAATQFTSSPKRMVFIGPDDNVLCVLATPK